MFDIIQQQNIAMKGGNFELSVFVQSISSFGLQKAIFYSVMLRAGPKQIQLPQKKSLTQSNMIKLKQTLTVRLDQNELENSRNLAKLQVYSVQKYGKKVLSGCCQFQFEKTSHREMKANFSLNVVHNAEIKFSYGFSKIQSRALSQKSYHSSSQIKSIPQRPNREIQSFLLSQIEWNEVKQEKKALKKSSIQNWQGISEFQSQIFEESYRINTNSQGLETEKSKRVEVQSLQNSGSPNKKIEHQHLVKLQSLNTTNPHLFGQARFDLQIQSNVVQHYVSGIKPTLNEIIKSIKELLKASISLSLTEADFSQNLPTGDLTTINQSPNKQKQSKLTIIKPKRIIKPPEEQQSDSLLNNIVYQMINYVKGNLSYIKLSKLTLLNQQITQTKNANRLLIVANQQLLQHQSALQSQVRHLEEVIKEKEEKFTTQLNEHLNRFKEAEKKMVQKYAQELFRQKKLKQAQNKLQSYQKQVKDLQNQIQIKVMQVKNMRQVISSCQDHEIPTNEIKKEEPQEVVSKQKYGKFKRSSSNTFNQQGTKSSKKKNCSSQKDNTQLLTSCPITSSPNEFKGINSDFINFFASFRSTINDKPNINEYQSMGPIKRNHVSRNYQKEHIVTEKDISIANSSVIIDN